MIKLILFTTNEELLELTGLPNINAALDAGFDLDDWDFGIMNEENRSPKNESYWLNSLLDYHSDFCENYLYNGKNFCIFYH